MTRLNILTIKDDKGFYVKGKYYAVKNIQDSLALVTKHTNWIGAGFPGMESFNTSNRVNSALSDDKLDSINETLQKIKTGIINMNELMAKLLT